MVCKILFITIVVLLFTITSFAGTNVTFRWDANSEPDLAGYRIFRRPAGGQYDYTNPVVDIPCGANDTTCTTGIDPDVPDGEYFWVVRAYDSEGFESEDSNEQTDILDSVPLDNPTNLRIISKEVIP